MKINLHKLPSKKSCLFVLFFTCMLVFASFDKDDRQKVRMFKEDLMTRLNLGNEPSATDAKDPPDGKTNEKSEITEPQEESDDQINLNYTDKSIKNYEAGFHPESNNIFDADENLGVIGTFSEKETDNVSDNFFTVQIPEKIDRSKSAFLEYDLFGLADFKSVPRAINQNIAIGGEIVFPNAEWSHQTEEINIDLLNSGKNTILFTAPSAGIKYKIKNLKVVFDSKPNADDVLNVSSALSSNKLYVRGYLPYP